MAITDLEIIDKRLTLFPEYLRYRLDAKYDIPFTINIDHLPVMDINDLIKTFSESGRLFVSHEEHHSITTLNFDGWLLHNGHSELSDLKPAPMYAIGIDPYYDAENGSFVRDEDERVVWRKDPNGRWRMIRHD